MYNDKTRTSSKLCLYTNVFAALQSCPLVIPSRQCLSSGKFLTNSLFRFTTEEYAWTALKFIFRQRSWVQLKGLDTLQRQLHKISSRLWNFHVFLLLTLQYSPNYVFSSCKLAPTLVKPPTELRNQVVRSSSLLTMPLPLQHADCC